MLYLLGSIVFTSYLTLSFKVLEKYRINNLQAIVFNYFTCVAVGILVDGKSPIKANSLDEPWITWAVVLGCFFVFLFNVIAFTTQNMGVAVASVTNKLSLVIPFLFSIYLYNETATFLKIAGIAVAMIAVIFTCWPEKGHVLAGSHKKVSSFFLIALPLLMFIGSGLLDTMIKYIESSYLDETNKNAFLITTFLIAGSVGLFILLSLMLIGKIKFDYRAVIAGVAIGIPNYISIWCLVRVLRDYAGNSSAIIPINNMGIVLFSTVVALFLFSERLTKLNWIGIILSIAAIALIAYG